MTPENAAPGELALVHCALGADPDMSENGRFRSRARCAPRRSLPLRWVWVIGAVAETASSAHWIHRVVRRFVLRGTEVGRSYVAGLDRLLRLRDRPTNQFTEEAPNAARALVP